MTSEQADHPDAERNARVIADFRANGSDRLVLLTTTGRKTGRPLTVPLLFMLDGDRAVIASGNHGLDPQPAWFLNLVANPFVTVEHGTDAYEALAIVTTGPERDRLLELAKTGLPFVAGYQQNTQRQIEIIALERQW